MLTTKEVQRRLRKNGINLLSRTFEGTTKTHLFRCKKGHEWETRAENPLKGYGCPYCSGKTLHEDDVKSRLKAKGMELIGSYIGSMERHEIRCIVCGFSWESTPNYIFNSGRNSQCLRCRGVDPSPTISSLERRDIHLVKFVGWRRACSFRCLKCGHRWSSYLSRVAESSKGCRVCARLSRTTSKEINTLLKDSGVRLIGEFKSTHVRHNVKCKCGARWKAFLGRTQRIPSCPSCHRQFGASEETTRRVLERTTGWKFPKASPSKVPWLHGLHLDGYNKRHKIAFEHQGYQHYTWDSYLHGKTAKEMKKSFAALKRRDMRKRIQCMRHGYTLICIPYWKTPEEIETLVRKKLHLHLNDGITVSRFW